MEILYVSFNETLVLVERTFGGGCLGWPSESLSWNFLEPTNYSIKHPWNCSWKKVQQKQFECQRTHLLYWWIALLSGHRLNCINSLSSPSTAFLDLLGPRPHVDTFYNLKYPCKYLPPTELPSLEIPMFPWLEPLKHLQIRTVEKSSIFQ